MQLDPIMAKHLPQLFKNRVFLIAESIETGWAAYLLQIFLQWPQHTGLSRIWHLGSWRGRKKQELRNNNGVPTDYSLSRNSYSNFILQRIKCAPLGCFCQKEVTAFLSWTWPAKLHGIRQKALHHSTDLQY